MIWLTAVRLRDLLSYDPTTGVWIWRAHRRGHSAGRVAGSATAYGYWSIGIEQRQYQAHRLVWLWMTGEWPMHQVDHINTNRSDNRWSNLREATPRQNNANARARSNNSSGFKGVSWSSGMRRWRASIQVHGRGICLGYADTPEEASALYRKAALKHFGEFARF